jgi:medium-chain acyl-[acyl-carrier-protein] hydrolase
LVEAIGPQLFGPWAVFGHSFGGLLAYETARAAVRDGYHQPEAVFVSACRPPDVESRFPKVLHQLSDDELIGALEDLGASPSPVLADPEMRRLVLPAVRADIELCETYDFVPDDVLEAPIVAFSGADDHHADAAEMKRWHEFTHGPFTQQVVPGGHFFLKTDPEPVLRNVKEFLNAQAARVR